MSANVYKFSIGRVSKNWNEGINSGILCANDSISLGENQAVKTFTRIDELDENGWVTGDSTFTNYSDGIDISDPQNVENLTPIVEQLGKLNLWEIPGVKRILRISDDASYSFQDQISWDDEPWSFTLGEGGELRYDGEIDPSSGLVVNVLPYYSVEYKLNSAEPHGVEIVDGEPSEDHDFCGICYYPSDKLIDAELDYADGDPGMMVGLFVRWKDLSVPKVKEVWEKALAVINQEPYPDPIYSAIVAAFRFANDMNLVYKTIHDTEIRASSGTFESVTHALLKLASALEEIEILGGPIDKSEINRLIDKAGESIATADDLAEFIQMVGKECYTENMITIRPADVEKCRVVADAAISKTTDSKEKTKLKKTAEKELALL